MEESTKNPRRSRLDFIRPRFTKRILSAREGRMAFYVHRLRVWLPLLAVTIVLLLILWPALVPNFKFSDVAKNIPDLAIDNLRFTGVDEKNQPYSLLAAQATKPSNMHGIYDLTKPEGEITLQSGAWIDSKADYGRYDETGRKLWLGGNVRIFRDNGTQITADEAQINLDTNEAWGDKNVLIQGAFGTIRGVGFRFLDSGHTVIINGPAKAVLSLHSKLASDKPSLP